jgi:mannitol-specific phosphotransferase system IIBC component
MQWTDRIRQTKIFLVIAAIMIAVVSLLVSHFLVRDLSNEERHKMETWAEALNALNNADENTDMSLVLNVIQSNNTIPVIVMDADGKVTDYRNIDMDAKTATESDAFVQQYGKRM